MSNTKSITAIILSIFLFGCVPCKETKKQKVYTYVGVVEKLEPANGYMDDVWRVYINGYPCMVRCINRKPICVGEKCYKSNGGEILTEAEMK